MYAIVSVAMNEELCVTGGVNGKIKVFDILSGRLIKVRNFSSFIFKFVMRSEKTKLALENRQSQLIAGG
jgi:hypothetical protein